AAGGWTKAWRSPGRGSGSQPGARQADPLKEAQGMHVLAKLDNALLAVLRTGVALIMAVTTVCVILQVYFRYVLNAPLPWSEELARYAMVWGAFIGGPLAIRTGMNVGITFVTDRLPPALQRAALVINSLVVIVFLAGMVVYGHE